MRNERENTGSPNREVVPKAASENLVTQDSSDETLVYDLIKNRAICLNKSAALVWKSCDGSTNIETIRKRIEIKLGFPVSEEFVKFALNQLSGEGLLLCGETYSDIPGGLSRREAVKKIGFSTMVALPIVSAVVAPKAAYAQSCVNPGGGAPGTPGNNATMCAPSAAACVPTCTTGFFVAGCCSGMGVVGPCVPFGAPPSVNCTCLCA
ncbi:MAG: PqqD family protein [Pyrinomonadaceae bacterium]